VTAGPSGLEADGLTGPKTCWKKKQPVGVCCVFYWNEHFHNSLLCWNFVSMGNSSMKRSLTRPNITADFASTEQNLGCFTGLIFPPPALFESFQFNLHAGIRNAFVQEK